MPPADGAEGRSTEISEWVVVLEEDFLSSTRLSSLVTDDPSR